MQYFHHAVSDLKTAPANGARSVTSRVVRFSEVLLVHTDGVFNIARGAITLISGSNFTAHSHSTISLNEIRCLHHYKQIKNRFYRWPPNRVGRKLPLPPLSPELRQRVTLSPSSGHCGHWSRVSGGRGHFSSRPSGGASFKYFWKCSKYYGVPPL